MANLRHLQGRAANALGRVGERYGVEWLVYSPLRMHHFHLLAKDDAPAVVSSLREVFPAARVFADVGCGSGAYAAEINARGSLAVGCERSRVGRVMARLQGVDARPFDLTRRVPAELPQVCGGSEPAFDLAYCIEVAEHVPANLDDRLVDFLCRLAGSVVFTAAQPGQGGTGHLNEQPIGYWVERFERHGFRLSCERSRELVEAFRRHGVRAHWLLDNAVVFQRATSSSGSPPARTSRRYNR